MNEPRQILLKINIESIGPKHGFSDDFFENNLVVLLRFAFCSTVYIPGKDYCRVKDPVFDKCTPQDNRQVVNFQEKAHSYS